MERKADADLVVVTLRLRKRDLKTARIEAKRLGTKYQALIRQWVAERAETVEGRRAARVR